MHESYKLVCDKHRELMDIVGNGNYRVYLDCPDEIVACAFLNKHYGCALRLVHLDDDLEKIFEGGFRFVGKSFPRGIGLCGSELREYVLENNKMLTGKQYDELVDNE